MPNINLQIDSGRYRLLLVAIAFAFVILILRLFFLQIIFGNLYQDKSEKNRLRIINLDPPRGRISDRHGLVLADVRPSFNLEIVRDRHQGIQSQIEHLAALLKIPPEELQKMARRYAARRNAYEPQLLIRDLNRDQVALIESKRWQFPKIQINPQPVRFYPYQKRAAHVLGYLREINATQLEHARYQNYLPGDLIGQNGIEKKFEEQLFGTRGQQGIFVDVQGRKAGDAFLQEPVAGKDLQLSIDAGLQEAAETALADKRGAVLAIDPNTGEILALASLPNFDPNWFASEIKPEIWRELQSGINKPMLNRAVSGVYPPGSVFKIFMSFAGLNEKVITEHDHVFCPGHYRIGNSRSFLCHKKSGHGSMDVLNALEQSCNVFYYTVGERLGVDRIHSYAESFGLGQLTGVEIEGEAIGLIPSKEWKKKTFKKAEDQVWYPGETPSVSIGQGAISITPLQIARALAALINGGKVLDLTLLKRSQAEIIRQIEIDPKILAVIKQGLFDVVNGERGTAHKAQLPKEFNVLVAGKTGTVQIKSSKFLTGKDSENNAWFAGYAPAENPEIVIVAIVEQGGHGGAAAAPIVREVLLRHFSKNLPPAEQVRTEENHESQ